MAKRGGAPTILMDLKLGKIEDSLDELMPLWAKIGELFAERQHARFESGATWAPLEASTLIRKRREGYPLTPLIATGALEALVSSPIPFDFTDDSATFGYQSGHPEVARYAFIQARSKSRRMPARNPVPPFLKPERDRIIAEARKFLFGDVEGDSTTQTVDV